MMSCVQLIPSFFAELWKRSWRQRILIPGFLLAAATYAIAQTPEPQATTAPEQQSVLQRPRPDFDPDGARLGSFFIYPGVDLQGLYNSNVFAVPSGKKGDFVASLKPDIALLSNWGEHALNFRAAGEIRRYAEQVSENESNFNTTMDGRLDILSHSSVTGRVGYELAHEDRTSPDTIFNQKNPTPYQLTTAQLGFVHERGIVDVKVDGAVGYYSYDNATTGTGVTVVETDRNRVEYVLTPRVSYELVPGYSAFVQASANAREYQSAVDHLGFRRDSHGYEIDAGTAVEITHILTGEVFAGYLEQDYSDSRLQAVAGPGFGGSLLWNVTGFTSIRASLTRTLQEFDLTPPASGYVETAAAVGVEHEWLRNLLLTTGASYKNDDFQGIARTDNIFEGDAGAQYLINRNLRAGLSLGWQRRESNATGLTFSQEIVSGTIRLQY
jgi:hypothetical protein